MLGSTRTRRPWDRNANDSSDAHLARCRTRRAKRSNAAIRLPRRRTREACPSLTNGAWRALARGCTTTSDGHNTPRAAEYWPTALHASAVERDVGGVFPTLLLAASTADPACRGAPGHPSGSTREVRGPGSSDSCSAHGIRRSGAGTPASVTPCRSQCARRCVVGTVRSHTACALPR